MSNSEADRLSTEIGHEAAPITHSASEHATGVGIFWPPEFGGDPSAARPFGLEDTSTSITDESPDQRKQRDDLAHPKDSSGLTRGRWVPIVLLFAATVLIVALLGLADRANFFGALKRAVTGTGHTTDLLATQGNAILMIEKSPAGQRVFVRQIGQASWLLVSQDDVTANNPAITPAGDRVAYVSSRDDGQILAVSLKTDTRIPITSADVAEVGKNASLDIQQICPWTPVEWSSNGERLAFFGCSDDNDVSFLMISDLTVTPATLAVIASSQHPTSDERQVKWLDAKRLLAGLPNADPQKAPFSVEYTIP